MKIMTCKQLGGACDLEFKANTFQEMSEMSKAHGTEMFQKSDQAHLATMGKMKDLMQTPNGMQNWFAGKQKEFDALPNL